MKHVNHKNLAAQKNKSNNNATILFLLTKNNRAAITGCIKREQSTLNKPSAWNHHPHHHTDTNQNKVYLLFPKGKLPLLQKRGPFRTHNEGFFIIEVPQLRRP